MPRLPWTKFQDFYLRLGFLKVLVAALSPQRRSAMNDAIVRRLAIPLFDSATQHRELWARVGDQMFWHRDDGRALVEKTQKRPTVAEALLVDGDCPSLLFAMTGPTAYKIIDWARNVEFLGRANQITERGLLLRHLLPEVAMDNFLRGNVDAWNPFTLSISERAFFLFHLIEIDEVMLELIGDLAPMTGDTLESHDAAKVTCSALIRVLTRAKSTVQPRDILAFRTACELTGTIAEELDMAGQVTDLVGGLRRRAPKVRPTAKRGLTGGGTPRALRRTTKNSDHQTIPRFEQLVDLGFLKKPDGPSAGREETLASTLR